MSAFTNKPAGKRVRALRTDRGWTEEDMALETAKLGPRFAVSARTIHRVEQGWVPTVRKQFGIAQVLGLVPSELWDSARRRVAA